MDDRQEPPGDVLIDADMEAAVHSGLTLAFEAMLPLQIDSPNPGSAKVSAMVQSLMAVAMDRYGAEEGLLHMAIADGLGRAIATHHPPEVHAHSVQDAQGGIARGLEQHVLLLKDLGTF